MVPKLEDLFDELHRGKVYECALRDPRWHLDGLKDGECVYVDPRPAVLETLLHELLHRRHQRWGERRVTREARSLIGHMTDADKARWWRAYRKIKRTRRPMEIDE